MDLTYKIVRRLLRDREVDFSRNKNFEAYEDDKVKRALRIARHLQSIETDILSSENNVRLDALAKEDGRVVVKLSYASGNGRRISYLSEGEWLLLLESSKVTETLKRLLDEAEPDTQKRIPTQSKEDE
jgi:hypothetical protein